MRDRARHATLIGVGTIAQVVLDARQGVSGSPVDTWTGRPGTSVNATGSGSGRPTTTTLNGQPALLFDGTDDFLDMTATAAGVFQNVGQGRVFVVGQTVSAVPINQNACYWSVGAVPAARFGVPVVVMGAQTHRSAGRRLDADTFSASGTVGNTDSPYIADSFADWQGNVQRGTLNGVPSTDGSFSSGGGNTQNLASLSATVGGFSGQFTNGPIAAVIATNQAWSTSLTSLVRLCLSRSWGIRLEA